MNNIDLNKVLKNLRSESKADWIGLREMKETTTYRVVRDLKPASNNISIDHGIMVEVLVDGQFGYYGTHNISYDSIKNATDKAYLQALNASKYSIHKFSTDVRPKSVGTYRSNYSIKHIALDDLMDTLLKTNKALKDSKKVVSAISMARIVDMDMRFVSTNGSNFNQSIEGYFRKKR